ncbi:hypothetical protein CABS01_16689 [Colletotrichum abscissum]|uniref:uncharacterized protein n=1 Tax=Colletotrichum abscissum TaxID=1671311 RepID=UPI0027D768AB|nr:uncharacterized protein CABS01_16689 [Colletotrichum abscissum]KAK1517227.1 hypothetical protein CABS01_16689 [Colletotrichum abscissum]
MSAPRRLCRGTGEDARTMQDLAFPLPSNFLQSAHTHRHVVAHTPPSQHVHPRSPPPSWLVLKPHIPDVHHSAEGLERPQVNVTHSGCPRLPSTHPARLPRLGLGSKCPRPGFGAVASAPGLPPLRPQSVLCRRNQLAIHPQPHHEGPKKASD